MKMVLKSDKESFAFLCLGFDQVIMALLMKHKIIK